jgi:hypothetical protein
MHYVHVTWPCICSMHGNFLQILINELYQRCDTVGWSLCCELPKGCVPNTTQCNVLAAAAAAGSLNLETMHHEQPSPQYWRRAVDRLHLSPSQVLHFKVAYQEYCRLTR